MLAWLPGTPGPSSFKAVTPFSRQHILIFLNGSWGLLIDVLSQHTGKIRRLFEYHFKHAVVDDGFVSGIQTVVSAFEAGSALEASPVPP